MSDFQTVSQLYANYAWGIDAREFELLHEVFAENASFVVSIAGTEAASFAGRGPLVDFISSTTLEQTDQRRHVITNVRVNGDKATANLTLLVVDGGELVVKSCGVYRCDLVQEGGQLRFGVMDLALDLAF